MTNEIVMCFDSSGGVSTLYTEEINLRELGRLDVTRVSSIEWHAGAEMWDVSLADGTYVGSWESREAALSNEVTYLNNKMKER